MSLPVPPIAPDRIFRGGLPIGGLESRFFGAGAPIAILGLLFTGDLPIAGPVGQTYRGGGSFLPPTLPQALITPGGPIGPLLVGNSGAPIGVAVIGGGGLPIGPPAVVGRAIAAVQARTALVSGPAIGVP